MARLTRLGDVLKRVERAIGVDAIRSYRFMGVRSFAAGCFDAGERTGSETRYAKLNVVKAGDFVYPKLMAWEGAFAVVPAEFDGYVVSPEFCTFETSPDQLDTEYLGFYFRRPSTWADVAGSSIGTNVRRRRLYPEQFLSKAIPLPDIDEQRRIAIYLTAIDEGATQLNAAIEVADRLTATLESSLIPTDGPPVPVGSLLDRVRREERPVPDRTYRLLGVRWYGEGLFVREERVGIDMAASKLYRVDAGDLVYNRLFAWKGSFAVAGSDLANCHVSNEFPTYRIDPSVDATYLMALLRQPALWSYAESRSSGGTPTSRNRLKEAEFEAIEVPLPPRSEQERIAGLSARLQTIRHARRGQARVAEALVQSAINHAFARVG